MDAFTVQERIAYFSMEIALRADIPTYSGGLGVLAGDTLRAAADCELPMVGVTLASTRGYFRQQIDASGWQTEQEDPWEPAAFARQVDARVSVPIEGRDVWVGGWIYPVDGITGGKVPVILLDTDLESNETADRELTHHLYGGDTVYRLKQEVVLGIGGARMLEALGFRVRQYHMNEGHSALLALHLLNRYAYPEQDVHKGESRYNLPAVRERCNFTTHTPVEAGHDRFGYDLVQRVLGDFVDLALVRRLAGEDSLNMTRLALESSEYVNGVAKRHAETSQRMFPGYRVRAVTNGVHSSSWAAPPLRRLFDAFMPAWRHEPETLVRADCCIPDDDLWRAHREAKQALIDHVRNTTQISLSLDVPIIGCARRMTEYKRPDLLFSDLERLRSIARVQQFCVVISGKAHPRDEGGKRLIQLIHRRSRELFDQPKVLFLPGYDLTLAGLLTAGCDIWLNTPLPPLEASGTSGMKAALNGVPNLSVLDGWWVEGHIEGVTGWAIGDGRIDSSGSDAATLYDKLERVVLPLYHEDKRGWIGVMKGAISKNGSIFTALRMIRRYAADAYMR